MYENEVSSLFDYVMLYMKIWKLSVQLRIHNQNHWLVSTYRYMCEIETAAYDLSKSVLIDAESMKFKPSIIVVALVTAAIEIKFNLFLNERGKANASSQQNADAS